MSVVWSLRWQRWAPSQPARVPVDQVGLTRILIKTYPPTVTGCLRNSSIRYSVVGQDGTVYNLTGDTGKLRNYIGREVEVTGKPTVKSFSTTEKDMASTVEEIPALDIKGVKELSKTCNPTK